MAFAKQMSLLRARTSLYSYTQFVKIQCDCGRGMETYAIVTPEPSDIRSK